MYRYAPHIAATAAALTVLSSCVNDPQHAIEIAHASCVHDWAPVYPPDAPEERIDNPNAWHAKPDGDGWLAWTGADEKNPGESVHISRFGAVHSVCNRRFQN